MAVHRHPPLPIPRVSALVLDFDGVLTDNRVFVTEDGREAVVCDRSDGLGLEHMRLAGIPVLVLSKEQNPVVAARCHKLRIPVIQALDDKRPALERFAAEAGIALSEVAYVGNDVNDLPCFEAVGLAVAVADAHPTVRDAADLVLTRRGGRGAVRELTDRILADRTERS